jgi:predicted nucleotidyltransferase
MPDAVDDRKLVSLPGPSRGQRLPQGEDALLEEIVQRVRAVAEPRRLILFGSRARGEERPDSDFDLLVIQDSKEPRYRRAVPYYTALADLPAEVEVMVYTPEEVSDWENVSQAFVTTAIHEGRVLYER